MKTPLKRILFWTPRILVIAFAVFLSLFALDVFDEHLGFWKTILALVIHLIPTWLLLLALAVSWRHEWLGAILFVALAGAYVAMGRNRLDWDAIICGPLIFIAVLFFLNWLKRGELRPKT